MKLWLYALGMCQSMFCALPFPWHGWEEKARDRMLMCLPLIGLEIGLIWWGLGWLCDWIGLHQAIRVLVLCAAPYLLTGFMHLDGLMDVTDAVRSYRSLERRREILKDSHVGSFSVIGVVLVILAQFALCVSLKPGRALQGLVLIPVVSRCCSVLAIQLLPPMETSQYAKRQPHVALPLCMLLLAIGWGFWMGTECGLTLLGCAAGYALALCRAFRSLKGMNGDISGYCLTLGELAGLAVLAILYR